MSLGPPVRQVLQQSLPLQKEEKYTNISGQYIPNSLVYTSLRTSRSKPWAL